VDGEMTVCNCLLKAAEICIFCKTWLKRIDRRNNYIHTYVSVERRLGHDRRKLKRVA